MVRITTRFWVAAYIARLKVYDIPAFVTAHGDDTGGAVLVKLNTLDGQAALYQRSFDLLSGKAAWVAWSEGSEAEGDDAARKQLSFDPDLWVIEVEDRLGRHLLGDPGLD